MNKHSTFCLKTPITKNMVFAAVYLKNENLWILVRGKIYHGGYLKYIHNGRESKSNPYNWRTFKGYSYNKMKEEISSLNINSLRKKIPVKLQPKELTELSPDLLTSVIRLQELIDNNPYRIRFND